MKVGVWAEQTAATRAACPDVAPEALLSPGKSWSWTQGMAINCYFLPSSHARNRDIFPERKKCWALYWPQATAMGKADQRHVGHWLSSIGHLYGRGECFFPWSDFQLIPHQFWRLSRGFAPRCFSIYRLLEVDKLKTPRHWPSSPHLYNTHPTAIPSASAGAYKTGIPSSVRPQLNWG